MRRVLAIVGLTTVLFSTTAAIAMAQDSQTCSPGQLLCAQHVVEVSPSFHFDLFPE